MPIDPFAALNAMLRAEVARTTSLTPPADPTEPPTATATDAPYTAPVRESSPTEVPDAAPVRKSSPTAAGSTQS